MPLEWFVLLRGCFKNQIIFQGGAGPKFDKFPLVTYLVMTKYQKLAKTVEGNWGFWFNFDFKNLRVLFWGFILGLLQMAFEIDVNISLCFINLWILKCEQ